MWRLLIILALSGYSCKKCADCTTTVTQQVTGQQPVTGTSTSEMCGDELDEADGYYNVAHSSQGGVNVTITTKTDCD